MQLQWLFGVIYSFWALHVGQCFPFASQGSIACSSTHTWPTNNRYSFKREVVAMTRSMENKKAVAMLAESGITCAHIPCIRFAVGPDSSQLQEELSRHDVIMLTSPQAAAVYLKAVQTCTTASGKTTNENAPYIAAVGQGTAAVLKQSQVLPKFVPSIPNAEYLANELPSWLGRKILYPASELASEKLQRSLAARGFTVTRLNTYTTVDAEPWSGDVLRIAKAMRFVTFSSPSAAKVWANRVPCLRNTIALTIGKTTADAAKALGFANVAFPEKPGGIEVFTDFIRDYILQDERNSKGQP